MSRISSASRSEGKPLSPRERDVLSAFLEAETAEQAAAALGISKRTIDFHLNNIFEKLGVAARTRAVVVALRRGDISL